MVSQECKRYRASFSMPWGKLTEFFSESCAQTAVTKDLALPFLFLLSAFSPRLHEQK